MARPASDMTGYCLRAAPCRQAATPFASILFIRSATARRSFATRTTVSLSLSRALLLMTRVLVKLSFFDPTVAALWVATMVIAVALFPQHNIDRPRAVLCRLLNRIYFVVFIYLFIYYAVAVAANKDVYNMVEVSFFFCQKLTVLLVVNMAL